jgi:hypothetical protein
MVHRRVEVTLERETVSMLVRGTTEGAMETARPDTEPEAPCKESPPAKKEPKEIGTVKEAKRN